MDTLLSEFDLVIGMDVVSILGGVTINGGKCAVQFGLQAVSTVGSLTVEDVDFLACFDGNVWTVQWK